jgi:hypothetical protein
VCLCDAVAQLLARGLGDVEEGDPRALRDEALRQRGPYAGAAAGYQDGRPFKVGKSGRLRHEEPLRAGKPE